MTGHGQAESKNDSVSVFAEVRSINNRYLKINVRSSESYAGLEPRVEELIRNRLRRGTIHVGIRVERTINADNYRLNLEVLKNYQKQIAESVGQGETPNIESLLSLPGVVSEHQAEILALEHDWEQIEQAVKLAISNLEKMRADEGKAMAHDLISNCNQLAELVEKIAKRAPQVVEAYQTRLIEKISTLLEAHETEIQTSDVVKEVGVFADRCDISEEVVRLRSHLEQFATIIDDPESQGRKLEFLTQEIFRETNTIGSKANDAEIAREVVEMKTIIERIREMIQNVE